MLPAANRSKSKRSWTLNAKTLTFKITLVMNKMILLAIFSAAITVSGFSQKIAHSGIVKTNINLRGNPVTLGQVSITPPANGWVVLRFDGNCSSTEGDRIVLAASDIHNWAPNDGNVELEAASVDVPSNAFSHTRSYAVDGGEETTFYAVAENVEELEGSGIASIYGSLTAEWFPATPGTNDPFVSHMGFTYENVFVEGAPIAFNSITINAPTDGTALVRFDGKCVSTYGDLMFFAASDTPTWGDLDESTSNEVIDDDLNRFSFSHVRSYPIQAGSHTFYGVAENYYETYGNGFASLYGNLTVEFYPAGSPTPTLLPISTPFGVNIEGPPVVVGEIEMNAPVKGKVEVNFTGTCIGNQGDQIRLAASDEPNWLPEDGCLNFEPYSSDLNRVSFSHTRVYEVLPGDHHFYAVVQNYEEFDGGGLAVIYGSLTMKYFAEGSIASNEPTIFQALQLSPNPVSEVLNIEIPGLKNSSLEWAIHGSDGRICMFSSSGSLDAYGQLDLNTSGLLPGIYFLRLTHASGTTIRKFIKS